ncbi:hypothetical protein M0R45_010213 [Rubus argutus]|uniref:Fungal lipase-type domain-containing protein n=1 Tax=Rubus argutus TaxID=59490 RepID=A0AAW1Y9Q8_RUBAR
MESIQSRVESWLREQRAKFFKVSWGPLQWRMRWPWILNDGNRQQRKRIHKEYERRRKQLQDLCAAVKADSLSDLQDILCCMVLSECVYKRPASELVRAVNKFKADFGGQIVSLDRVQPSSDHVPHRYLLAEAGDTLFASFIGTKQVQVSVIWDVMTDANILQGAIFHEDPVEDTEGIETNKPNPPRKGNGENSFNPLESKTKQVNDKAKPAAHRGFLALAKGIPDLELYRLAQKKKRNLVLCGHSLGGAVAVSATLAILRVVAASSSSKENGNVRVKCITFSRPPVEQACSIGYLILVLGIVNVFKGMDILNPAKHWRSTCIITVAVLGGIGLFLETVTCIVVLKRRSSKSTKPYDIRFCRALSLQQRDWIEAVSILSDVMADPVSITLFHASEGAMDQGWCRPTHKEQRQGVGSVGGGVLTVRCSPGRAWTPLGFAGIGLDCGLMGLA